eukprot:scpid83137/ scgid0571/ 
MRLNQGVYVVLLLLALVFNTLCIGMVSKLLDCAYEQYLTREISTTCVSTLVCQCMVLLEENEIWVHVCIFTQCPRWHGSRYTHHTGQAVLLQQCACLVICLSAQRHDLVRADRRHHHRSVDSAQPHGKAVTIDADIGTKPPHYGRCTAARTESTCTGR